MRKNGPGGLGLRSEASRAARRSPPYLSMFSPTWGGVSSFRDPGFGFEAGLRPELGVRIRKR